MVLNELDGSYCLLHLQWSKKIIDSFQWYTLKSVYIYNKLPIILSQSTSAVVRSPFPPVPIPRPIHINLVAVYDRTIFITIKTAATTTEALAAAYTWIDCA